MKDNLLRYTLRISPVLMDKFAYIARYEGRTKNKEEGRTKNKEIEQLIKKRVQEFEREHGKIDFPNEQ